MRASREQIQQEALSRAATGQSLGNWPAILAGFAAKGISESDIRPRENVFTYHAWRALGRQVRRGEHRVKVVTFVTVDRGADPMNTGEPGDGTGPARRKTGGRRPWSATVFHVFQTDPVTA
jgi:N-terminal domain of anti-restriction factor ArdC